MAKALVCYFTKTGNVLEMAMIISNALRQCGIEVTTKPITETVVAELKNFDCIIVGSPTMYGSMSWLVKKFLDESVNAHGELVGKIGGAFTSCAYLGGGNESTLMGILKAFLIHGMIIQGNPSKNYFGPVSLGAPNDQVKADCIAYAENIAELANKLFP
jgi:NAD(P)H dehydrogenase (quinone)